MRSSKRSRHALVSMEANYPIAAHIPVSAPLPIDSSYGRFHMNAPVSATKHALVLLSVVMGLNACSQSPQVTLPSATGAHQTTALSGGQPNVFIGSELDTTRETVKLPLLKGNFHGATVWYVVTDSSDKDDAARRHVNWAPRMTRALGTRAVQTVTLSGNEVSFSGTVDFSPARVVRPGPAGNEFAGGTYQPGAVGDANYSPLITTGNGVVLNATQVANTSGVHDSVVTINYTAKTVSMSLFFGFWNGHKLLYLHQEASSPVVAAAEGSTYTPNLDAAPTAGSNDRETSARAAIIPIVNGPVGNGNPQRQGLNSALRGEGDPLNVTQEVPGSGGDRYTPVWDVHPVVWTDAAIAAGQRERLASASEVRNAFDHGLIVSGGNGPANASLNGLRAANAISNCPVVALF